MKKLPVIIFLLGIFVVILIYFEANPFLKKELSGEKEFSANEKDLLLPDIVVSPPAELYIEQTGEEKKIRFSTTFYNQGEGRLELVGRKDSQRQVINASQKIVAADGSTIEREVGEFVLHPEHSHWHVEDYVVFELWSLEEDGQKDKLLAKTRKMSFCIWDQEAFDLSLEGSPQSPRFLSCNSETQGLSVGWSDTYLANVEGQELDISQISDGKYRITTFVNPDQKIFESNYDNNKIELEVEIVKDRITILNN